MGKSSERAHFIKEVGSGKLAQDLKSKYIKATKSQFSRITKKTSKLSSTIKESLNLPKLKNLQNLKSNKELNESLNKWLFQEKSDDSDESDSKKLLYNGKAEKLAENIDDSSFCMKQTKGWINCFKRANHKQPLERKYQNPSSFGVESYSKEIDLSANFVNSKTCDLSINSSISDQQESKEILSKNLLKNVDDFYTWCERQMDISTQDLVTLKKLRDNAENKLESLDDDN